MGNYKDIEKRKEYVKEYQRKFNEKKYICECGEELKVRSKTVHLKSKKHILTMQYINLKEKIINSGITI